jgi:sulfur-carrier protein
MKVSVTFFSYFKDLTGTSECGLELASGTTLGQLHDQLITRFPKLGEMRRSTLMAVGVEYQDAKFVLSPGDEVALFPPVQGG